MCAELLMDLWVILNWGVWCTEVHSDHSLKGLLSKAVGTRWMCTCTWWSWALNTTPSTPNITLPTIFFMIPLPQ